MLEDFISQDIWRQRRVAAGVVGDGYGRNPAVLKGIFCDAHQGFGTGAKGFTPRYQLNGDNKVFWNCVTLGTGKGL